MIKKELHITITQSVLSKNESDNTDSDTSNKGIVALLHEAMISTLIEINETDLTEKITKQAIKQAIHKGALWRTRGKNTQRLRRIKTQLHIGDTLHFYYDESVLDQQVAKAILIADHTHYSIWYKPYGMLSQGSKWSDHCTITRYAQQHFNNDRSCFIVHRLDKAATGLIIVAHTKKATRALTAMFEAHQFDKRYQIIVDGDFSTLTSPYVIDCDVNNKASKSIFSLSSVTQEKNQSLINVQIETGRKHQIRQHAASIGMPVVGDRLYGIKEINTEKNLQLCAVSLTFQCPLCDESRAIYLPELLRLVLE